MYLYVELHPPPYVYMCIGSLYLKHLLYIRKSALTCLTSFFVFSPYLSTQVVVNSRNCLKLVMANKNFTAEEAVHMKESVAFIFGGKNSSFLVICCFLVLSSLVS